MPALKKIEEQNFRQINLLLWFHLEIKTWTNILMIIHKKNQPSPFLITINCKPFNPFHATGIFLYPLKTSESKGV